MRLTWRQALTPWLLVVSTAAAPSLDAICLAVDKFAMLGTDALHGDVLIEQVAATGNDTAAAIAMMTSSSSESRDLSTSTSSTSGGQGELPASIEYSAGVSLATVEPVVDCSDLLAVNLDDIGGAGSRVSEAEVTVRDGVTYCSVTGELPPAVGWQVLLPVFTWTQRYMQVGCGGLCGMIMIKLGAADGNEEGANGNFVLAATDMNGSRDGKFGLDKDKRAAFAHRAQHQTALVSKKLILAYYGQEQAYSYFNGCSDGGREGIMEAMRYPDDFDGIIAGAPAMLFTFQNSFHHGWLAASNTHADGSNILMADRLPILHDAVVDACDALDGLKDGLLTDPRLCNFDPSTIECASEAGDTSACLRPAEVEAVKKIYAGPIDPDTRQHLTLGDEEYGSELAWAGVFVGQHPTSPFMSSDIALTAINNLILEEYPGDDYTLHDFVFHKATIDLLRARHPLLDAVSPDLSAFHQAGRKLILWHGWADSHISARTTIAYHEAMQATMGEAVDEFERLYLLPGVYHCGRGEGPSAIDLVTPMMRWVEDGVAPDEIIASSESKESEFGQWPRGGGSGRGGPRGPQGPQGPPRFGPGGPPGPRPLVPPREPKKTVTRPVYPYPKVARYVGSGDVNKAANFQAGEALYTKKTPHWLGEDFFNPYIPLE